MTTYFVNKRSRSTSEEYQIVYRQVKTRTHKGYPVSYELVSLPENYKTWEEAMQASKKLNAEAPHMFQAESLCPPPPY